MGSESFADKLKRVLQGEPLRAISYGAAAVVWITSNVLYQAGLTQVEPPTFDASIVAVAGGVGLVTELARRFVYSPVTVDRIIATARQLGAEGMPAAAPPDQFPAEEPRFPA